MHRILPAALLAGLAFTAQPATAQSSATTVRSPLPSEMSSQARPGTRLRVYPGRLLYRECSFHLVQEWRPSGTVIVPRQRCWWVRG